MKLYIFPGACSLADHLALKEAGMSFDCVKVDLATRRTEDGSDYLAINAKGYVPALEFDDGQVLTENVAILDWIAQRCPRMGLEGELGRTRMLEMLGFISTEVHKQFGRIYRPSSDAEKAAAIERLGVRFEWLATQLKGDFLFGAQITVADAYLYVTLLWANMLGVALPDRLQAYKNRLDARPAVQEVLRNEGLVKA